MAGEIELNEVTSPPYPGRNTTAAALYVYLQELRSWVMTQRGEFDDLDKVLLRPDGNLLEGPGDFPLQGVWNGISVVDKYVVLRYTRSIREHWDHILREHEDAWDSLSAVRKRLLCVLNATVMLEEMWSTPEAREAHRGRSLQFVAHSISQLQEQASGEDILHLPHWEDADEDFDEQHES